MIVGWVFDFRYPSALVETHQHGYVEGKGGLTGIENVD